MKGKRLLLMILIGTMLMGNACATAGEGEKGGDDVKETTLEAATTELPGDEPTPPDEVVEVLRDPQKIKKNGIIDYTAGEGLLYNGIKLPESFKAYADNPNDDKVMTPAYLL